MTQNDVAARVQELVKTVEGYDAMSAEDQTNVRIGLVKKAELQLSKEEREAKVEKLVDFALQYGVGEEIEAIAKSFREKVQVRLVTHKNGLPTGATIVNELFTKVGDTAEEMQIFQQYKLGRGDMHKLCGGAIKQAKNADSRKWIHFDAQEGLYTLVGIGADAPQGWTGYIPPKV